MNKNRVGFYCWAGPNTIKMIRLKFFNPKIDTKSLMSSYDLPYLLEIKDKFNITDFWGMYSWGFSDKNEQSQREFLTQRINNFKKAGIKLHAYVQGPNVVYKDFKNQDWYCVDNFNRPISYYTGRRVVCINNPEFVDYKLKVIKEMLSYDFDGIYMDNIQMGQLGIPLYSNNQPFIFAGCNCIYCRTKFKHLTRQEIPLNFEKDSNLTNKYLKFREDCTTEFISKISELVHSHNKEFGTNSFDPKFNTSYVYGTNLKDLENLQDYLLFENHSLPREGHNNNYIEKLSKNIEKPIFVVSYKNGIGGDSQFTQQDFDNIYTEDNSDKFFACYKGSEYVTNGKWHNLYLDSITKPHKNKDLNFKFKSSKHLNNTNNLLEKMLLKRYYNPAFRIYMENRAVRNLASNFASKLLQS